MEPLYIDFSDSVSLSGKTKFVGILMSALGLIGSVFCIVEKSYGLSFYLILFYLVWGVFMLTPYPYRITSRNKPFIKIDDSVVEYRTAPFSYPRKEEWKNISSVTIKPHSLILETNDSQKRKVTLNWISQRNVLLIKQTIREYATLKDLDVFLINS
ncbi:MAG TPA: hypothetical protein DIW31_00415 [Bacteroidales bacterium]|nr:hypothetical protein [Bacteroidales bacterium]